MNNKENTNYQKNIGSAALFALAILILVVSCPLKRLLTNNFSSQTSILSKSKPTNNTRSFSVFYSNDTSCYTDNDKEAVLQADKIQQIKTDAPVFTANIFNHTGYYIHSFLGGIKTEYNFAPTFGYSSLPLFLQHRSLLI